MEGRVQCAGECRGYFDRGDLDDLGLCEPCGDSYYGNDLDDDFGSEDEEGCYVSFDW